MESQPITITPELAGALDWILRQCAYSEPDRCGVLDYGLVEVHIPDIWRPRLFQFLIELRSQFPHLL